jgi:hypothetical protein
MQFLINAIWKKVKENGNTNFLNVHGILSCGNQKAMRREWRKNNAGRQHRRQGSHAAHHHIPVCWNLDFNWIPSYIRTYLIVCILHSDIHKIWFTPELPKGNWCREVSVFSYVLVWDTNWSLKVAVAIEENCLFKWQGLCKLQGTQMKHKTYSSEHQNNRTENSDRSTNK